MEIVFGEIHRVLKPGRHFALYVSDSHAKGKPFAPLGLELFARARELFTPVDHVCVVRHNRTLKRRQWHIAALEGNYFLRGFNHLLIFRKERA